MGREKMERESRIEIRIIDNNQNYLEERKKDLANLSSGRAKLENKKTIVFTPKIFAKVFTPERIRLIKTLQEKKIESISNLAEILSRSFEAVDRDVKYLESMNLLTLIKKEKSKVPIVAKRLNFVI